MADGVQGEGISEGSTVKPLVSGAVSGGRLRALYYSHDSLGLGHFRRTTLLCEGMRAHFPDLSILIIAGSPMAHAFRLAPHLDYVKVPSVFKRGDDCYVSRALDLEFAELLQLRERIIFQTVVQYQPDLFFVDNVPLGLKGEIVRSLKHIRRRLPGAHTYLVLRDILDHKDTILSEWRRLDIFAVLESCYDQIFVCGLPLVFDFMTEYQFPERLRRKTSYCGYIHRGFDEEKARKLRVQLCAQSEKLIVVTLGGGSDGAGIVRNYLNALPEINRQRPVRSVILLGPDMDPATARQFMNWSGANGSATFFDFSEDAVEYLAAADAVVCMGGYNTISEVIGFRKRAIVIPRVYPRSEQLIRSRRLEELGLLEMIHPGELTPARLAKTVVAALDRSRLPDASLEFSAIEKITAALRPIMRNNGHAEPASGTIAGTAEGDGRRQGNDRGNS